MKQWITITIIVIGIIIAIIFFWGCSVPQETIIKTEIIKVPVPVMADTVYVVRHDTTVIEGQKVVGTDTIWQIKYYPKADKFYAKVKPDTILITRIDTVRKTTIIMKPPDSFLESTGKYFWWALGSITLIGIILLVLKWKKII